LECLHVGSPASSRDAMVVILTMETIPALGVCISMRLEGFSRLHIRYPKTEGKHNECLSRLFHLELPHFHHWIDRVDEIEECGICCIPLVEDHE
jgi:hypothetical protein